MNAGGIVSSNYPDIEICSHCLDNAVFAQDEDTEEWLSVCCDARGMDGDVEEDWDFEDLDDFELIEGDDDITTEGV